MPMYKCLALCVCVRDCVYLSMYSDVTQNTPVNLIFFGDYFKGN